MKGQARRSVPLRALFLSPAAAVMGALFVAPLGVVLLYSFLNRGVYGGVTLPFTVENFLRLIDPLYLRILWRSLLMAGAATLGCLVLAFPLALFISRAGTRKNIYLHLVMLPFWTCFLVRTYAWMFLLRDTGLVNSLLLWMGVIREPLPSLMPAVAAAALVAFTVSFDDYVITSLVAGVDSQTLPMVIYAMAWRGVNPVVNAVSALIVVALGTLILFSERLRRA